MCADGSVRDTDESSSGVLTEGAVTDAAATTNDVGSSTFRSL
jgi:hypothetical protein